jgi:hypothetical protein
LAANGIKAALHAGASLLGFAEGTATVIKGVEIGQAAAHIGDIIELGVEQLEDSDLEPDEAGASGAAVNLAATNTKPKPGKPMKPNPNRPAPPKR